MVAARFMVEAPPTTPQRFGLLSAATVVDRADGRGLDGITFEPGPCGDTSAYGGPCDTPTAKSVSALRAPVNMDPFIVYTMIKCRTVGQYSAAASQAEQSLLRGETIGVEEAFAAYIDNAGLGATNLTPAGGGVPVKVGLSILEQAAGAATGNQPTIHMARNIATLLFADNVLERSGNRLETKLGSLVAAGGGYGGLLGPSAAAAAAGNSWMWITGPVSLIRGAVIAPDRVPFDMINEFYALAERGYAAAIDTCVLAAVQVQRGYT